MLKTASKQESKKESKISSNKIGPKQYEGNYSDFWKWILLHLPHLECFESTSEHRTMFDDKSLGYLRSNFSLHSAAVLDHFERFVHQYHWQFHGMCAFTDNHQTVVHQKNPEDYEGWTTLHLAALIDNFHLCFCDNCISTDDH